MSHLWCAYEDTPSHKLGIARVRFISILSFIFLSLCSLRMRYNRIRRKEKETDTLAPCCSNCGPWQESLASPGTLLELQNPSPSWTYITGACSLTRSTSDCMHIMFKKHSESGLLFFPFFLFVRLNVKTWSQLKAFHVIISDAGARVVCGWHEIEKRFST